MQWTSGPVSPPVRAIHCLSCVGPAKPDIPTPPLRAECSSFELRALAWLSCLRGISTLTGFCLAVEIGDWDRFTGASIGAYLGLVPSEHSSGARRSPGLLTWLPP